MPSNILFQFHHLVDNLLPRVPVRASSYFILKTLRSRDARLRAFKIQLSTVITTFPSCGDFHPLVYCGFVRFVRFLLHRFAMLTSHGSFDEYQHEYSWTVQIPCEFFAFETLWNVFVLYPAASVIFPSSEQNTHTHKQHLCFLATGGINHAAPGVVNVEKL